MNSRQRSVRCASDPIRIAERCRRSAARRQRRPSAGRARPRRDGGALGQSCLDRAASPCAAMLHAVGRCGRSAIDERARAARHRDPGRVVAALRGHGGVRAVRGARDAGVADRVGAVRRLVRVAARARRAVGGCGRGPAISRACSCGRCSGARRSSATSSRSSGSGRGSRRSCTACTRSRPRVIAVLVLKEPASWRLVGGDRAEPRRARAGGRAGGDARDGGRACGIAIALTGAVLAGGAVATARHLRAARTRR